MKIKTLTLATVSALYGVGMAASVQASMGATSPVVAIQQIKPTATKQYNKPRVDVGVQRQMNIPGGLNQHIQPASAKDKIFAEPGRSGEDVYIVRLRDMPVATYDGRVKGFDATAKTTIKTQLEQRFKSRRAVSVNAAEIEQIAAQRAEGYENYLLEKQDSVISQAYQVGVKNRVRTQFTTAMNAFSIKMTQQQAIALAGDPNVAFIQRSEMLQVQTDRGPQFIKADKAWAGDTATNLPVKGEGIIMGILDTGINSDHVSFADIGGDGYDHTNPLGEGVYLGDCADGSVQCNDKLIGVYSWPVITDEYNGAAPATGEDYNGHGSHTAGTAAGNYVENVPLLAADIDDGDGRPYGVNFASVSGVAPHANIIAYQVCLADGGCPTEAVLKAYEQAIKDGVDVINFSIGGAERFPWEDPTELAILSAREAGISVAVAAGNSGGDESTTIFGSLGHSAPWEMVVAASTHDRVLDKTNNTVEFSGGNSSPYVYIDSSGQWSDDIAGYSQTSITGTPVLASDFGDEMCNSPFPEGTFSANDIVLCKRGDIARVTKAFNVQAGGAGGFILYNNEPDYNDEASYTVYDDLFPLPGLHVTYYAGQNIMNWMNDGAADHQITINGGHIEIGLDETKGDILADFSSLGPSMTYKNHLAPHIAAPGVAILAPWADQHPITPGSADSRDWAIISGTSMASPHIAGSMALIRQAHPDWSAAEVQSALEMTASQTVKRDVTDSNPDGFPATKHRAGAGRVDVQAAVNAGLIMDETVANFELANPDKGGDVRQLNLPQLVDSNCRGGVCSWMRTVKATRDGSWTLSEAPWTYDRWTQSFSGEIDMHNAKLEFFPASFSLQAGETQTIVVKANIKDFESKYNSNLAGSGDSIEGIELWTDVILTPSDAEIPQAHWPVSINFDRHDLPATMNMTVHRDEGSYRMSDMAMPASDNLVYRGYGTTKAQIREVTLPQDNNHMPVYSDNDWAPGNNEVTLIEVPENTARLIVEVLGHTDGPGFKDLLGNLDGTLAVHIGRDFNRNGEADFDEEWVCSSTTQIELNYCNLNYPDAGTYWVLLSNSSLNMFDWNLDEGPDPWGYYGVSADDLVDTYKVATALVPKVNNNLTVEGPSSSDGVNAIDVDLTWSLDDMQEGDIAYAGFDMGTSASPGSMGFVPVRLERGVDDISVATQNRVRPGQVFDVSLHLVENNSGMDRDFDLSTELPDGLMLVPGSLKVSSSEQEANLTVDGSTIRIAGVQRDSGNWMRTYNVTTSDNDPMCKVPNYGSNGSGFVGLAENYGFIPEIGGTPIDATGTWEYDENVGDWVYSNPFEINLANFFGTGTRMSLFHNDDYTTYDRFIVSPQGFITFGPDWAAASHMLQSEFPYYMFYYGPFVAPFWRGEADMDAIGWSVPINALSTPLEQNFANPADSSGITMGYTGDELILEWINARTAGFEQSWFGAQPNGIEYDDRYTFDLIINTTYRYGDGQFEFVMAYGDMDFADQGDFGSIGLHGNYGPLDVFGWPYGQETGISAAYNNLSDTIKRDTVICWDYTGPEATQFDVTFQVRASETAAGKTVNLDFMSIVSGMGDRVVANSVSIVGNIQLAGYNDMTIEENESAEITVAYVDSENDANVISVTGDHITAVADSNEIGATVTITPEANWYGETLVTVKVADALVPSDMAEQTFLLTVNSDGVEPAPVVVPTTPEKKTSGGSMGIMLLTMLALSILLRRKSHA